MDSLTIAIIGAVVGAALSSIPWAIDKFSLLSYLKATKFNFSGKWKGISEFVDTSSTAVLNDEHYFLLDVQITQKGKVFTIDEKITGILDNKGKALNTRASREFIGQGTIFDNINLLFNLDEKEGLTCGTGYLVSNTWGNELSGYLVVRNENSSPVIVKILLAPVALADAVVSKYLTSKLNQIHTPEITQNSTKELTESTADDRGL